MKVSIGAWQRFMTHNRGSAETDAAALGIAPATMQTPIVHDTGGQLVPPGCTALITTRPQRCALRPVRLYVEPGIAEHFALDDIKIGGRSQFQQAQSIPCAYFARHDNDGEPNGPTGERILCETVQTAMDFVLVVTNTSDVPRRFVGTWTCEPTEHPLAIKLREAEAFIERERYGYNLQIEQLRDLAWRNTARCEAVNFSDDAIRKATDSYAQAFDTSQKNLTARIGQLEYELSLARAREAQRDLQPKIESFVNGELDQLDAKRAELMCEPAGRALLTESGPSAVAAAPTRESPVDRWQRGAPCTWDPHLGDE